MITTVLILAALFCLYMAHKFYLKNDVSTAIGLCCCGGLSVAGIVNVNSNKENPRLKTEYEINLLNVKGDVEVIKHRNNSVKVVNIDELEEYLIKDNE